MSVVGCLRDIASLVYGQQVIGGGYATYKWFGTKKVVRYVTEGGTLAKD